MSYANQLRKGRDKAQVAFHEFSLSTRKLPTHLFCFFEGKDNAYYVPRIKRYTAHYHPIKCGGREKVLKVYDLITNKTEYRKYKKAFFIDKDFNPTIGSMTPPIFETPCYSIESLYVSQSVFKDIITNELHLSSITHKISFQACLDKYEELQKQFHDAILLFNAWYACLIDKRNATGEFTGVNLDDKPPKGLINITLGGVMSSYTLTSIKNKFPNAPNVTEIELKKKKVQLSREKLYYVLRGKYEMYFLLKYLQLIIQDSNGSQKIVKDKIKFSFGDASGVNNEQAINIFEGYAETPESLLNYLSKVTQV